LTFLPISTFSDVVAGSKSKKTSNSTSL
jgi:hypothetical protein